MVNGKKSNTDEERPHGQVLHRGDGCSGVERGTGKDQLGVAGGKRSPK